MQARAFQHPTCKVPSTTHSWPCKLAQSLPQAKCVAALHLQLRMQRGVYVCSAVFTQGMLLLQDLHYRVQAQREWVAHTLSQGNPNLEAPPCAFGA